MAWRRLSDLVTYQASESGGIPVLKLAGELDLLSARPLRRLTVDAHRPGRPVVIDLTRVTFADAGGLSGLLSADRRLKRVGARVVIRRPHRIVRRLLDASGLGSVFEVEDAAPFTPGPDALTICAEALDGAMRIGRAERGNMQLVDPSGSLRIVAERGFARPFLDFFAVVEEDDSACGRASSLGRPVRVRNVAHSPIFVGSPTREVVLDARVRSVASVPVWMPDGTVGAVISVHRSQPTDWTDDVMGQLADHAALTGQLLTLEAA